MKSFLKKKKSLHIRNIYVYLRQQLAVNMKFLFFFFLAFCVGSMMFALCKTIVAYGGLVLRVTRKV